MKIKLLLLTAFCVAFSGCQKKDEPQSKNNLSPTSSPEIVVTMEVLEFDQGDNKGQWKQHGGGIKGVMLQQDKEKFLEGVSEKKLVAKSQQVVRSGEAIEVPPYDVCFTVNSDGAMEVEFTYKENGVKMKLALRDEHMLFVEDPFQERIRVTLLSASIEKAKENLKKLEEQKESQTNP